jgi:hypothetical protein
MAVSLLFFDYIRILFVFISQINVFSMSIESSPMDYICINKFFTFIEHLIEFI